MKTTIFFIIAIMLSGQALRANVIEVCPTCPISTVRQGIHIAQPCDTVLVKSGTYAEGNLLIDNELTLLGEGLPVLDGNNQTEILTVTSNWVSIEGFQIQNVGVSYTEDRAGIRMKEVSHFSIKNNRLLDAFFGIYLQRSKDGVVEGNFVEGHAKTETGSGNAIHLWNCDRVLIFNNYVSGHRDGIYLEFVNQSHVEANRSERNVRYGLHFMFSNNDTYRRNTFRHNGAGVAVMYSKGIAMHENLFEQNWGAASYGLLLKDIHDADIEGNIFKENTIGVFAETSNRVNFLSNRFEQNGWAIKISGGCQQNHVTRNHFTGNSFDLAVHSAGTDNRFDGNFWADYSGYDLDRDGIGDVPHRPMKLFSYVVSKTPEAIVLLRSLFVDILNFSEKVSPIFTPENVVDNEPMMKY